MSSRAIPYNTPQVGAINTTLLDCPWLKVEAIDILSRHERIRQIDFFKLERNKVFDVIVSSMVINSLPTPKARGEMLKRCHAYLCARRGHMFLMLPLSCLTHSKSLSVERFKEILSQVGFQLIQEKTTPKIAFFVCQASAAAATSSQAAAQGGGGGGGKGGGDKSSNSSSGSKSKKKKSSLSWAKDFDVEVPP